MVSYFADGGENNNFDLWDGTTGSPTIVGAPVKEGALAFECDDEDDDAFVDIGAGNPLVYFGSWVKIDVAPGVGEWVEFMTAKTITPANIWRLFYENSAGVERFTFYIGFPGWAKYTAAIDIDTDWHWVEVMYKEHGAAGGYKVNYDDVEKISDVALDTSGGEFRTLKIQKQDSNYGVTVNFDDIRVEDGLIGTPTYGWTGKALGITNPAKVSLIEVANIASILGVT